MNYPFSFSIYRPLCPSIELRARSDPLPFDAEIGSNGENWSFESFLIPELDTAWISIEGGIGGKEIESWAEEKHSEGAWVRFASISAPTESKKKQMNIEKEDLSEWFIAIVFKETIKF